MMVGHTGCEGSRPCFGALVLAVHDAAGALTFAGKVGSGFDQAALEDLHGRLAKIGRKAPAFANPPRGAEARRSHWVEPKLVAEVAFTEWTDDGVLRHPSFQGLREDKDPAEIVRERPIPAAKAAAPKVAAAKATPSAKPSPKTQPPKATKAAGKRVTMPAAPSTAAKRPAARSADTLGGVRLTHPDRVLYPDRGLTKRDLALYYERIADWILPHVGGRPLSFVRCPEGVAKQCFYQKHVSDQFPASIARVDVGEAQPYGAVEDLSGLHTLVQMGVLEIHISV
jgi:bifunctional non-homologous end joining protein LigD